MVHADIGINVTVHPMLSDPFVEEAQRVCSSF